MSLQIWLPLTKDLRNQGLLNNTVINNGATYSSIGGNLGGCYIFDGTDDSITIGNLSTIVDTNFSFACWFYHDDTWSSKNYETIFGGPSGFELEAKQSSTNSPKIHAYSWGGSTFTYDLNKWNHLVMTRTTSESKFYLNGELKLTGSAGSIPSGNYFIGSWSSTTGQNYKGKICDVRIYDHCLSPMEVKELAKGLVLHYPLNRQGWGQENLHKYSDILTTAWVKDQATVADGIVTITPTTNADRRMYQMPANGAWTWQANTKYTASVEAKSANGAQLVFYPYGGNTSGSSAITVTSEWKRYSYSFTTGGSPTTGSMTYSVNQTSGVTLQLRRPKLELGSIATPWCPNSSDALATTMGLNSTTEYDCSGFCNNGTRTGTFTWTSDTPKYQVSTYMPAAATISHTCCLDNINQEWSCAAWVKPTTAGNYQNLNNFNESNRLYHGTYPLLYANSGTNDYYNYGNLALPANQWSHIVFVFKNSTGTKLIYINGENHTNTSGPNKTSTPKGIPDTVVIGSGNYEGGLCDYREYATALSADDVKSLYQNSAYIDSSGNVYGPVFSEVN